MVSQCNVCGKKLADRAKLQAHVRSAHPASVARLYPDGSRTANSQGAPPAMRGGGGRPAVAGAPVAYPRVVSSEATESTRMHSTERFGSKTLARNALTSGGVIFDVIFTPDACPRLSRIATLYQRVQYHQIRFDLIMQNPTTARGGYIAGFIADPAETQVTVAALMSNKNSVMAPWYQSSTIVAEFRRADVFYTDPEVAGSPRWYSPGTFWALVDNAPADSISAVLTVTWDATFSVPTAEKAPGVPKEIRALVNLWSQKGTAYLRSESGQQNAATDSFDPPPPKKSIYRLPFPISIEYKEGGGDTGSWPMHFLYMEKPDGDPLWYPRYRNQSLVNTAIAGTQVVWQSDVQEALLLPSGTVLTLSDEQEVSNLLGPPRLPTSQLTASGGPPEQPSPRRSIASPFASPTSGRPLTKSSQPSRSALTRLSDALTAALHDLDPSSSPGRSPSPEAT